MDYDDESNEYGDEEQAAGQDPDQVIQEIEQEQAQALAEENAVEAVLSNAMDRMDEANLWKLFLSQDMIEPGSAPERVAHSVNSQLRQFALNRLEVLLGMNKPKQIEKPMFDREEIRALRILAAKMNGRSVASV